MVWFCLKLLSQILMVTGCSGCSLLWQLGPSISPLLLACGVRVRCWIGSPQRQAEVLQKHLAASFMAECKLGSVQVALPAHGSLFKSTAVQILALA